MHAISGHSTGQMCMFSFSFHIHCANLGARGLFLLVPKNVLLSRNVLFRIRWLSFISWSHHAPAPVTYTSDITAWIVRRLDRGPKPHSYRMISPTSRNRFVWFSGPNLIQLQMLLLSAQGSNKGRLPSPEQKRPQKSQGPYQASNPRRNCSLPQQWWTRLFRRDQFPHWIHAAQRLRQTYLTSRSGIRLNHSDLPIDISKLIFGATIVWSMR